MLQSVEDPTLRQAREKYHERVSVERLGTVSTSLSQLESTLFE